MICNQTSPYVVILIRSKQVIKVSLTEAKNKNPSIKSLAALTCERACKTKPQNFSRFNAAYPIEIVCW